MKIIALAGDYPAREGAPVLRAVDTRIFTLRYFRRCLGCDFCKDQCCDHGVDVDADNARRIASLGPEFETLIGVPRSDWFEKNVRQDEEFPSGEYTRTRTHDGHCVFRVPEGRGCRIHEWCLKQGVDYHEFKPLVSVLFPLTFERGVLVPSGEILDGTLVCSGTGDTLYEGVRDELAHYFDIGLVDVLDALAQEFTIAAPALSS